MKTNKKITSLVLLATAAFGVFGLAKVKSLNAEAEKLNAGKEIAVSINGNLDNVNIKFEFTSSVELDGTNNALLVGLVDKSGNPITDERFVASSTKTGVFDEDGTVISFENAPATIGTKTSVESNFKYTFESRDFTATDLTKDIGALVVIGQKGAEINTEVAISEVKYSVQFGSNEAVSYSYNATIADPTAPAQYVYDFAGHQEFNGTWTGNDSSTFVSGSTKATKDIVYTAQYNAACNHTWSNVAEVPAGEQTPGVKAHQECECGAKRLDADSTTLATDADLKIIPTHNHSYAASFDWTSVNPGDKPVVTYTCSASWCDDAHVMDAADITIEEVADSRHNATCSTKGSVQYKATCTYEGVYAEEVHEFELATTSHNSDHHSAVAPTLLADGNVEYWTCADCNGYFLDEACTQATTAEGIKVAKYTAEDAQYISVSNLSGAGKSIKNADSFYTYDTTNAPEYNSVVFLAEYDYQQAINTQIYIVDCSDNNWANEGCLVIRQGKAFIYKNDATGTTTGNAKEFSYSAELEVGQKYQIEYGRLALMNGETFTGKYHVYFKLNGQLIGYYEHAIKSPISNGGCIHFTGGNDTKGYCYLNDVCAHEEGMELSVGELMSNGNYIGDYTQLVGHNDFTYDNDDHTDNYSIVFKFKYVVPETEVGKQNQFHFTDSANKWSGISSFILNNGEGIHLGKEGGGWYNDTYAFAAGEYDVEFGRLANTLGGKFTGTYYLYLKVNDVIIKEDNYAIAESIVKGNVAFITANGNNYIYDIDYVEPTYEVADEISLSDLTLSKNGWTGEKYYFPTYLVDPAKENNTFTYTAEAENNSVVLKFKYEIYDTSKESTFSNQIHFSDGWLGDNHGGVIWFRNDKTRISKAGGGYLEANPISKPGIYDVEVGKIYITAGSNAGMYRLYIKVDGEQVLEYLIDDMPDKAAIMFTDNDNTIYDINYSESNHEVADVISVNDLSYTETYTMETATGFNYYGKAEDNSVKFQFQYTVADPSTIDCQFIFNNGWYENINEKQHGGIIWLSKDKIHVSKDGGGYISVNSPLTTAKTYNIEVGKIYHTAGAFEGMYRVYIIVDGVLKADYFTADPMPDTKAIFITGKNSDVLTNIAINKTVTIKVGEHTEDVTVLQSGLVTIPTFGTEVVAADKRIVSWTIEGTETAFNPLENRVYDNITIVATIDDFKWKVVFGEEEYFIKTGEEITLPEETPTKAYDDVNHYTFEAWVDAEGTAFVAGTKATADVTYTAKFTATAHSYGEWETVTAAGCETDGLKQRVCTCGHIQEETIPAAHTLVHHEAVAATCTTAGSVEYYECTACHKLYSDAAATTIIEDVVVAAHGLTHHDASAPTCTKDGNIEYWECETCHKYYKDAAGTQEVASIKDPKKHDLTKVEAKAATCEENGNIEYYHCNECGKNYKDAAGTELVSNVSVAATGHTYGENGICTVCGAKDPNYVEPKQEPAKKGCNGAAGASSIICLAALALLLKKRKSLN